jgi:3',5'-cyclic AMP phosphodiesterase CpdA
MNGSGISRRKMILSTGAGAAGAILSAPAFGGTSPTPASSDALRFGIIADVHQDVMHDGERRLRLFIDEMNRARPDFIVQLGDFCVPHQRNDAFMKTWNGFAGRRYHVIGNHETDGGYSRDDVVEYFGMERRYYSFDESGVHFVVLDGNDRGGTSGGYPRFVADDQMTWLRNDLAAAERPTVVLIHQPLDSSDGVDNRAAVRELLEESNRTPGHARVIAVVAGHSHVDYCRLVNGIYYLMVNSASYQWVGGDHRHDSYPAEIHAKARWLDHTCPYRDPLWVVMIVDTAGRTIQINGRSTVWVGPSPAECGADYQNDYWGWDPAYSQPRISSWRLPFAAAGDLA